MLEMQYPKPQNSMRYSRRTLITFLVVSVCSRSLLTASCGAAPVTFTFAGEITAVKVLSASELPFDVAAGDTLTGKFALEPFDAEPGSNSGGKFVDSVQDFNFDLILDSTSLTATSYSLNVRDNIPFIDAPFSSDVISLSCFPSSSPACEPGVVPGSDSLRWAFSLPMTADGSAIDGPDLLPDPRVWNQFLPSYLTMTFRENGSINVLTLNAKIERFELVPEPSASNVVLLALLVLAGRRAWFVTLSHGIH